MYFDEHVTRKQILFSFSLPKKASFPSSPPQKHLITPSFGFLWDLRKPKIVCSQKKCCFIESPENDGSMFKRDLKFVLEAINTSELRDLL